MDDGGEVNIEWFPPNYNDMNSPIIFFLLGSFGTSNDIYAKELAHMVRKNKWRLAIFNRRGWDY